MTGLNELVVVNRAAIIHLSHSHHSSLSFIRVLPPVSHTAFWPQASFHVVELPGSCRVVMTTPTACVVEYDAEDLCVCVCQTP